MQEYRHHESLDQEYDRLVEATMIQWASNDDVGRQQGQPEGYFKLGISVGSPFKPTAGLMSLFNEISILSLEDPGHIVIPANCWHFTFLALAEHVFSEDQPMPPEIHDLKRLCDQFFRTDWRLDHLRIVPGPNFLLLVGTPSADLISLRAQFAGEVIKSSWRPFLQARHQSRGYPFPPRIWHTTLCRYTAEFLPPMTRCLFERFRDEDFGSIDLAPPKLRRVNYDWSFNEAV